MKKLILALLALFPLIAQANTSTINPNIPATGAPLSSAPIRDNFAAAYSDINILYGLIAASTPAGPSGSIQINNSGSLGPLTGKTLASYAAHNTVMNGIAYDPRAPAYGAICGGTNTFAGNGSATTFTYTIPFVGSSSTDNSGFMVFYEPTNGSGSATILNTSQFSVTGVNSGSGGTITLNSAPPASNTLFVVHDDGPGLVATSVASVLTGGYISVPDGCTIYSSQTLGTQLAEGAQLIGQNFTPNYIFTDLSAKPVITVIAPTGFAPKFGFNVSGINKQFFEGFEITTNVSGVSQLAYLTVPALIGATGASGAGGGQSPGITAQYVMFNHASVGFGSAVGDAGNTAFIFATLRFNNFVGNNYGIYGPLSDAEIFGNDFNSNQTAGLEVGPANVNASQSAAGRIGYNRFEFNADGIIFKSALQENLEGNQFDQNKNCAINFSTFWSQINITGGWAHGNGTGGSTGNTTAGQDAHFCFNSGAGSGGLHVSNMSFYTNYDEGNHAPIGSPFATTPVYWLDFNSPAANNTDIEFNGGDAQFVAGNNGASVWDSVIYRQGRPTGLKINVAGQAVQGAIANGNLPSQARGLASNAWSLLNVIGDISSFNNQFTPLTDGWGYKVAQNMGAGITYDTLNSFSFFDCDVVNQELVPNIAPRIQDNAAIAWLPSPNDPSFGAGFYTAHETDTNSCRMGGLTWAALPQKYKVYGQSTSCVQTGSGWSNSASYTGYYGVTDSTNGDSLACTVTTNGGPAYLWYLMQGSNGGTFTYQLDSGPLTTVATQGQNQFTFPISTSSQTLGGIRIPVLTAGSHTVNIVVTSATSGSNTVTIEGVGAAPGIAYHGKTPTVFLGGQVNNLGTVQTAAVAAFNADQFLQANELAADGLAIDFANVQQYINTANDYDSAGRLNASGQGHIAEAFNGAMQQNPVSMNAVNPMDYGASCNTKAFVGADLYSGGAHGLVTTASSPTISINNYTFQPGVATQTGGGDVGKYVTLQAANCGNVGHTTYIASVNTGANTATLGETMNYNCDGTKPSFVTITGYPSNPNDPSTAHDDTLAIHNASYAAQGNGNRVFLPPNCEVHNLNIANNVELVGNQGALQYSVSQLAGLNTGQLGQSMATPLWVGFTGYADDIDPATGKQNDLGINFSNTQGVRLKDFSLICPGFPAYFGIEGAGMGVEGNGILSAEAVNIDHVTTTLCPIGLNSPFGLNQPVTATATINGTAMMVSAITSTNFAPYYSGSNDFLAVGRPITGTGVTAATYIFTTNPVNNKTIGVNGTTWTFVTSGASGNQTNIQGDLADTLTQLASDLNASVNSNIVKGTYTSTGTTLVAAYASGITSFSFTAGTYAGTITGGTTITAVPLGFTTGTYTLNQASTVASPETVTSAASKNLLNVIINESIFANNSIGMNGDFSDSTLTDVIFSGNFAQGWYLGPNTAVSSGTSANRMNGGRFEENNFSALTLDTTLANQFTGVQWQFNGGCNVSVRGLSYGNQFTGGMMQGAGPCVGTDKAMFSLGGTGNHLDVSGMSFFNVSGGITIPSYIFETTSGSTFDYITAQNGQNIFGYSTAFYNWSNATPTHYKVNVPGVPFIDTTGTKFTASGCSLSATLGGPTTGQFTSGTSGTCTVTITMNGATGQPAANGYSCSAVDLTTPADTIVQTASSTTTATISGTTVSGDTVSFNCFPY